MASFVLSSILVILLDAILHCKINNCNLARLLACSKPVGGQPVSLNRTVSSFVCFRSLTRLDAREQIDANLHYGQWEGALVARLLLVKMKQNKNGRDEPAEGGREKRIKFAD